MASRITLPFWPSSLDCLRWSSDNIIAVGGGDQIGILTPRLQGPGPDGTFWNSTYFKANAFTSEEAPLLQPLTFTNFSPGEELSNRHVQALEWSPLGLARFGQCVLAVLSSNHVLSLWECDGRADAGSNWKRKVIINHALMSHYSTIEKATGETDQLYNERKQVSQRVRAFAWSPRTFSATMELKSDLLDNVGSGLMAVSSEAGDIAILHIRSPYNILDVESTDWQVDIMHTISIKHLVVEAESGIINPTMSGPHSYDNGLIADHVAYQSWSAEADSTAGAALFFIVKGKLYSLQIQTGSTTGSLDAHLWRQTHVQRLIPSQSDLTGPLKYIPKTSILIVFAPDTVYCLQNSTSRPNDPGITSHHLDNRWDEISGIAICGLGAQSLDIHIISHLSSSIAATNKLSAPLDPAEISTAPRWQAAIAESKELFNNQYDLGGYVQDRTWGIASSPLGDCVATATTLVPSDSIAHVIRSDRNTSVDITRETPSDDQKILQIDGPNKHITAEVKLFHLQRCLEQTSMTVELETLVQAISCDVLAVTEYPTLLGDSTNSQTSDSLIIARKLKHQVLGHPEMYKERNISLARIALGLDSDGARRSQKIIQHLVSEVIQSRANFLEAEELSDRICRVYQLLDGKLNRNGESTEGDIGVRSSSEICRICEGAIYLESVKWARCSNGHQFSRCALTFLTIQEPGFSKHCGVCGVQVFDEWKMLGVAPSSVRTNVKTSNAARNIQNHLDVEVESAEQQQTGMQPSHNINLHGKPTASLARVLFAAFDVCIYCGGKFVA